MANDKKVRLSFTPDELTEIYMGLGARIGMLTDGAAIRDQRPSEIAAEVSSVRAIQDRIFTALHDEKAGEASEATS